MGDNGLIGNEEITIEKLVYPKYKYVEGCSPNGMYFPGTYLMFKMMRACLGCRTPKDLWFNRKYGDPTPTNSGELELPESLNDSELNSNYREFLHID